MNGLDARGAYSPRASPLLPATIAAHEAYPTSLYIALINSSMAFSLSSTPPRGTERVVNASRTYSASSSRTTSYINLTPGSLRPFFAI